MRTEEYTHEDGTRTVDTYDDIGHLVKVEDVQADGSVSMRITYRWDGNNNAERIVTNGSGNQIRRLFFRFVANRELGYEEFDASDKLAYRVEYGYGEPDGKIRVKVFDGLGTLIEERLEDFV